MVMDIQRPRSPGYDRWRERIDHYCRVPVLAHIVDGVFVGPDLLVTFVRILGDPTTPAGRRLRAVGKQRLVTVSSAPSGQGRWSATDELLLGLLTVQQILASADPERLTEYWPSRNTDVFQVTLRVLTDLTNRLPRRIHERWQAVRSF